MGNISSLAQGLAEGLNGYLQGSIQQKRQQQNFAFQQGQEQQTHAAEGQSTIDQAGKVTPDMAEQLIPGASKWVNSFQQQNKRLPTIDEVTKGLSSVQEKLLAINNKGGTPDKTPKYVSDAQKGYNTDIKTEQQALMGASTAEDQIKLAVNNPVAYNSVPITLAKMMTGTSRINQMEIQKLGGSSAVTDRLSQIGKQMTAGTLTADNAAYMENLTQVLKQSHQENIEDLGVHHASQLRRLTNQDLPTAYNNVTGNPLPDRYTKPVSQHPNLQPGPNLAAKKAALRAKLQLPTVDSTMNQGQ